MTRARRRVDMPPGARRGACNHGSCVSARVRPSGNGGTDEHTGTATQRTTHGATEKASSDDLP
eukprot:1260813-Prymnesium_polylepis.2